MKQRHKYQLPLNWRKRKRYLEKELKKKVEVTPYCEIMEKLIGKEEYEMERFMERIKIENRKMELKEALEKLCDKISHRYENAFVMEDGKLYVGKMKPYHISYCDCACKGYSLNVERRRLNTAYVDDELNYITCCIFCYITAYKQYEELWKDYYASIL